MQFSSNKSDADYLDELFHDKKIRPIFWIITVVYAVLVGVFALDLAPYIFGKGAAVGIILVLLIPYLIFATIYIIYVYRKD